MREDDQKMVDELMNQARATRKPLMTDTQIVDQIQRAIMQVWSAPGDMRAIEYQAEVGRLAAKLILESRELTSNRGSR